MLTAALRTLCPVIGVALIATLSLPDPALAYVGPGAGLTAIGTALALILAIGLAIVGFVWFPLKRMMRKRAARTQEDTAEAVKAETSQ